jgi:hypothetical protein
MVLEWVKMRKPGGSEKSVRRMRRAVNCTTGMAMIDRHPTSSATR